MLTYVDFSLFESPAKVLVNTVNTVGVMGKGIAKEFKRIYPEMFREYQDLCDRNMLSIGELLLHKTDHKWILNFPTKTTWRRPSKQEYIDEGLRKFVQIYQDAKITSVSFPMLGCGNGELDWEEEVKPLMENHLRRLPIRVFIHVVPAQSTYTPEHVDPKETRKWLRSQPQSLAFSEVWGDIVKVVQSGEHLRTLDGMEVFSTELLQEEGKGIIVHSSTGDIELHKEQLLDLWQQIRDVGVCMPQIMPSGLDMQSRYVMPILAKLDYFRPILQTTSDTLKSDSFGLLLKSPSIKQTNKPKSPPAPKQLQLV